MVYLVQTDTTVGFLSSSKEELAKAKRRDKDQPYIITLSSFKKIKKLTRIPPKHKNLVRRSKKTTFIYPNNLAIRVVQDKDHKRFLEKFEYLYSSSANRHKEGFNLAYALDQADVIIKPIGGFVDKKASKMIKLYKNKIQTLRKF